MGAQQSKSSSEVAAVAAHEKAVLERLQNLRFEDDFVHVHSEKGASFKDRIRRVPEGLDIEITQDWQSKLLSDPKNRFVASP